MEEQMMSGITVDEIARKLGVTRSTLFRKFRDRYRVSPKEHLDTVRIERARRLLIQSNAPIRDIAGICGYEDGHYFSRAFKRQIGCTPSEARARR
jgi:transcriptional regulator GlxA family with amidase domain